MKLAVVKILEALQTLGALLTAVAMLGCFGFGILRVVMGFHFEGGFDVDLADKQIVDAVLSGLELLFIAPLPFFAFRSITKLLQAWVRYDPLEPKSQSKIDAVEALKAAQDDVGWVKRFISSLMIAIIATDMIHRMSDGIGLDQLRTATSLGMITVLCFYCWIAKK